MASDFSVALAKFQLRLVFTLERDADHDAAGQDQFLGRGIPPERRHLD